MEQWKGTEGARDNERYPFLKNIHSKHTALLNVQEGDYVLDLGCGRNPINPNASANVIGIDPDDQLVHQAVKKAPNADFSVGIGDNLPFANNKFDVVFMRGIVHHLNQEQRHDTFAEISRVLSSGGELITLEPDPDSWYRKFVWSTAARLGYEHEESPHIDDDGYANPEEIKELCINNNMKIKEQYKAGSLLSPLAFLYPLSIGVGVLTLLYKFTPANWWSLTRASTR